MTIREQKILKLKNNVLRILNESEMYEGFDDENIPDLKYYAFDWDDNVVHMPTKILVESEDGEIIGMSTEDYEIYKDEIYNKEPIEYKGHTIVGFPKNYLINFGEKRQSRFIPEAENARPAPSFRDFRRAINSGSIFAIITARGLNPNIIKEAVKMYINTGFNGINKLKLIQSLKKYKELVGEDVYKNDDEMVNEYLDSCRFYAVTYKNPTANVSAEKNIKLEEFHNYVTELSDELKMSPVLIDKLANKEPTIGISDDSQKNISGFIKDFGDNPRIKIISTAGGERKKLT